MCAICGIYHLDRDRPVAESDVMRMARTMRHRGPDDEGAHVDGNLGLGHQRLSIIDLSSNAHQPMTNEDGRLWIILNGEIYNYQELRQQLLSNGHRFISHSDTEVILHLYEERGPECVQLLNGMFAFAIWDSKERTLFAARDHFGVKPFYYSLQNNSFVFASEIKALFQSGSVSPSKDLEGLADYLTFQFCLGDKTMFRGVRKLLPGHWLTIGPQGRLNIQKYWDLDFEIDEHAEDFFQSELVRLLSESVRMQLRADVPVGAHLSGGLDSSTVVCLAARQLGHPLHTFSGGFHEGRQYDETPFARIIAQKTKSNHHEYFPTAADFVEVMPKLIYHMDEPAAGPGLFPQYFISRLARESVKVVLGGQGGDEIFGGYVRYLVAYLDQCIKGGIAGTQEEEKYVVTFESILPNLPQLQGYEPLLRSFWRQGALDSSDLSYFRLVERGSEIRNFVANDALGTGVNYSPYETFRDLFNEGSTRALINKMTRFDMKTLLPALLQVEDRTSMSVSLESRVPLLDHRIAKLVASMPPMIKYKGGRSKHIFREAVRHIVPAEIVGRSDKMGFPVPLNTWYTAGPVRDFVHDVLLGAKARQRGLFQTDKIEQLLHKEQSYGRGLWGLLCLELWIQTFLEGPIEAAHIGVE